jgi:ABC-type multidrug transport system ATPase subunit
MHGMSLIPEGHSSRPVAAWWLHTRPVRRACDCESHHGQPHRVHPLCDLLGPALRWPDGTTVFDGLNLSIGPGRTGLVGTNGTGKSTLLRLLAGQLRPSQGSVTVGGSRAYLPQDITLDTTLRVDQALGIAGRRAALRAIEAGDVSEEHFATIGDDWDVEERALATLGSLGLGDVALDRTAGQMSGGQTVLLRLAAALLERPEVLLLDEPTNNLDLLARRRLYAAVDSWRTGVLVVVSHDRELLERVDRIAELRSGSVTWYGGGWTENSVIVKPNTLGWADAWKNGATSLVPSPVMSGTPMLRWLALPCCQPTSLPGTGIPVLEASRLPAGAVVSSRRSCPGVFPFL